jgi:hypothetical protein
MCRRIILVGHAVRANLGMRLVATVLGEATDGLR